MAGGDGALFLVGFMGAGKSAAGEALARRLGWDFIDLDRLVVEREGRPIEALFEALGEAGFREAEQRALESLRGRRRVVVACGGGTYALPEGRRLIDAMGRAIWLDVPLRLAVQRCLSGPPRPLLRDAAQAEALYRARLPAYRGAPLRIDAAGATSEEVADRIVELLGSSG
jgi:shikimate kinase